MKFARSSAVAWLSLYFALAIAPVVIAYLGPTPDPRTFWIEFSVGLGFVGLAIMGLQFLLTGRFRTIAASYGLDTMLHFHKQAGIVAALMIFAHPVILIAANSSYLSFLDPRVNLLRALALSAVLGAIALIVVTTIWRQALKLSYELWRTLHGVLALFILFIGLVHILQVGNYVSVWWKQAIWIGMTAAAGSLLVKTRIWTPWRLKRRPYEVADVRPERARSWTLRLRPIGHSGFRFRPGQFAWVTIGESPYSLQQHPFSISSSALDETNVEMTVKELGDFTSRVSEIPRGQTAFVEGPYGAFFPAREPASRVVMIAAGVGITPLMSMLRTFRDARDPRPITLIYGNRSWEEVLFRDELDELRGQLDLRVIHVLSAPDDDWPGERGRITDELLDRHLTDLERDRPDCFVCGPQAMMDAVERYLRARGVPLDSIFSERFQIV